MTLPQDPPPFAEGGPPQSQIAPGDHTRELIHEVRNLTTQVALLHTIFVKRTVLYWILGIETFIVASVLVALSIFVAHEHSTQQAFADRSFGSCQVRNAQIDATRTYLQRQLDLQQQSQGITASFLTKLHVQFSPAEQQEIVNLTIQSQKALRDYFVAQPKDVVCKQ